MEYCGNCQKNVCIFTDTDRHGEIIVTRVYCMLCNRELYNQTKSEKLAKVKNYIKNPSKKKHLCAIGSISVLCFIAYFMG